MMAAGDEVAQKDKDVIEMSDFVDSFLKDDDFHVQNHSLFWKKVLTETSIQQT